MYALTFESLEQAEDLRQYLKEYAGIDLGAARETSGGEPPTTYYEFESYGYRGFVMEMVYTICFYDGNDYTEIGRLPNHKKEKYLENQLFSHAIRTAKTWNPPSVRSRELQWVSDTLGLSEHSIQNVVLKAEKRYYRWLKMEKRYSLLFGLACLVLGGLFAIRGGMTSWPALLFFSFTVLLLVFYSAKVFQDRKKRSSRLPR